MGNPRVIGDSLLSGVVWFPSTAVPIPACAALLVSMVPYPRCRSTDLCSGSGPTQRQEVPLEERDLIAHGLLEVIPEIDIEVIDGMVDNFRKTA